MQAYRKDTLYLYVDQCQLGPIRNLYLDRNLARVSRVLPVLVVFESHPTIQHFKQ